MALAIRNECRRLMDQGNKQEAPTVVRPNSRRAVVDGPQVTKRTPARTISAGLSGAPE
jgi:hypothetical protein